MMHAPKSTDCPSEETLMGFADGTLREGREAVEDHVARCERCLSIVADVVISARPLAGATLETPPVELERQLEGRPMARPTRARPFLERLADALFSYRAAGAVAAASVVALVVLWVGHQDRYPIEGPSVVREGPAHLEGPVLLEPAGETRDTDPVRFRWEACPEAQHYVIVVVNADSGRIVVREAVSSPEYTLPVERLVRSGGDHYEWLVECTLEDGRVLASRSTPFQLTHSADEE